MELLQPFKVVNSFDYATSDVNSFSLKLIALKEYYTFSFLNYNFTVLYTCTIHFFDSFTSLQNIFIPKKFKLNSLLNKCIMFFLYSYIFNKTKLTKVEN
jgi:hypothetical protein